MHPSIVEAAEYLRTHLAQGVPEMHLREHFLKHGWSEDWFNAALAHAQLLPSPQHHQPRKYTVRQSLTEFWLAFKINWRAYVVGLLSGYVGLVLGYVILVLLLIAVLHINNAALKVLGSLVLAGPLLAWYAFVSSYILATTALALRDGLNGRRSSLKSLVQTSLRVVPRATLASIVSELVILAPAIASGIITLIIIFATRSILVTLLFGILLWPASIVWAAIATLRLVLVQQVAILEPGRSLKKIFGRSSFLLSAGGQWFVVKVMVLFIVLSALISIIGNSGFWGLLADGLSILVGAVFGSTLSLLYFNRAAVKRPSH